MNSFEVASIIQSLMKLKRAKPDTALLKRLREGDQTILFAGQVGGHLFVQAWLQDGPEELVMVYSFVTSDHVDPEDAGLVDKTERPEFYMTRNDFRSAMSEAMSMVSVW